MPSGTISTKINTTVTVGPGAYPSLLTITGVGVLNEGFITGGAGTNRASAEDA